MGEVTADSEALSADHSAETLRLFAERFVRLTASDVRRLADWTRALQGDRPASGREWRAAVSREVNSIGPHPAEVARQAALASMARLLEDDARSTDAVRAVDGLVARLVEASHRPLRLEWTGKRQAAWTIWFGIVAGIAGIAFIAAAIGVGLGGRRELMSVLALIAFGLIAAGFVPYLVIPLLPPTDGEARMALSVAIVATALAELLPMHDYAILIEPWKRAIDVDEPAAPPRMWKTAVVAGRLVIALITGGAGGWLASGFLRQLGG